MDLSVEWVELYAARKKLNSFKPDTLTGYWNAKKRPNCDLKSGLFLRILSPLNIISPLSILYYGWPIIL